MNQQQQLQQAMHIWAAMLPVFLILWAVKITLYIIPMYRIAKRAGMSPGLAFLAAIPLLGRLITLYVFAFSEWRVSPLPDSRFPPAYPPTAFNTATYPPAPAAYPPAPATPVATTSEPPHTPGEPPTNS